MSLCLPGTDTLSLGHQTGKPNGTHINPGTCARPVNHDKAHGNRQHEGQDMDRVHLHGRRRLSPILEQEEADVQGDSVLIQYTQTELAVISDMGTQEDLFTQDLIDNLMDDLISLQMEADLITRDMEQETLNICQTEIQAMNETILQNALQMEQTFSAIVQDTQAAICNVLQEERLLMSFVEETLTEAKDNIRYEDALSKEIVSGVFEEILLEEESFRVSQAALQTAVIECEHEEIIEEISTYEEHSLQLFARCYAEDVVSTSLENYEVDVVADCVVSDVLEEIRMAELDRAAEEAVKDAPIKLEFEESSNSLELVKDPLSFDLQQEMVDYSQTPEIEDECFSQSSTRWSMTNVLSIDTPPVSSDPVLVTHQMSRETTGTSTPNIQVEDFRRLQSLGRAAASERTFKTSSIKDKERHPRRRSAGDLARALFRTVSRPFRRRYRPREVRESQDPGGTKDGFRLKMEMQGLDTGSTKTGYKARADPSSKDPGGVGRKTLTNPNDGRQQGSNKTRHKEARSDPSSMDPGGTFKKPTTPAGQVEGPQEEEDPAHRPIFRTRTQRILGGMRQSLTQLGRPLVACFGGG